LELAWDAPVEISHVQLVFDTGFQRELTLTSHDGINKTIIRAPQPETVKDYELQYRVSTSGKWQTLAEVKGNHQRLVRHTFEPAKVQALRVLITATNGDKLVRVFEVRCYPPSWNPRGCPPQK
jgi:hypothetical protein